MQRRRSSGDLRTSHLATGRRARDLKAPGWSRDTVLDVFVRGQLAQIDVFVVFAFLELDFAVIELEILHVRR